jgi:UDP-N-acetylglucosamine 2-epimerase (non-hydrolysing)
MIAIVFGTRPEFLKLKPIIEIFKKNNFKKYKVIYVMQHENLEENFDFDIERLTIDQLSNNRLSDIGSQILIKLPNLISDCDAIIIQGDTATAFYSALVGFQNNKKIIYIEAGLRTYDLSKPYPEEGYRQMISRISSINFTPHEDSSNILRKESVSGKIFCVGNTILDLVNSYNLKCSMDNLIIITFHRRENWDKIDDLLIGLKKLMIKAPNFKYLWYLHPNPNLQKKVKESILGLDKIELKNPTNHTEFTQQISKCNFLITDSGGIQEEASFLGKHCIVLRTSTERSHIPDKFLTILEDYTKLDEIYEKIPYKHLSKCTVYGIGESASQIYNILNLL